MLLICLLLHVMVLQREVFAAKYEELSVFDSDLSHYAAGGIAKPQNGSRNGTDCKHITPFHCSWGAAGVFATPQCVRNIVLSPDGETDCLKGPEVEKQFETGDFNRGASCAKVVSVRGEPLCTRDSGNGCAPKRLTIKKRSRQWFDPILGLKEDFIENDLKQCSNSQPKKCANEICDFLDCRLSNSLTCGNLALIKYCKSQPNKKKAFIKKCKGTQDIPNECYPLHYEKNQKFIDSVNFDVSNNVLNPKYISTDFKDLCADMDLREKCSPWLKSTFSESHYTLCGEVDPDASTSESESSTSETTTENEIVSVKGGGSTENGGIVIVGGTGSTSTTIPAHTSESSTSETTTMEEGVDGKVSDTTENGGIAIGGGTIFVTSTIPTSDIPCEIICGNVTTVSECGTAIEDEAVRIRCEPEATKLYEEACKDKTDDENCKKLYNALVSNGGGQKKSSGGSDVIIIVAVILVLVLVFIIAALLLVKTHRNRKRKKSMVNHGEGVKKTSSKTIGLATDMDIKSVASLATPATTAKNKTATASTASRVDRETSKTGKKQLKTLTQPTSSKVDGKSKRGNTSKPGSSKTGSTPKQRSKASQKSVKSTQKQGSKASQKSVKSAKLGKK